MNESDMKDPFNFTLAVPSIPLPYLLGLLSVVAIEVLVFVGHGYCDTNCKEPTSKDEDPCDWSICGNAGFGPNEDAEEDNGAANGSPNKSANARFNWSPDQGTGGATDTVDMSSKPPGPDWADEGRRSGSSLYAKSMAFGLGGVGPVGSAIDEEAEAPVCEDCSDRSNEVDWLDDNECFVGALRDPEAD